MKNKKRVPDDVILVFSGIFVALVFVWSHMNSVYSDLDFVIYFSAFIVMIVVPMVWSSIVHYRGKMND